jgi:hypothetical protein
MDFLQINFAQAVVATGLPDYEQDESKEAN